MTSSATDPVVEGVRPFRFVLDPTASQDDALSSHCGAARFAYNHMLALVKSVMDQRAAERSYGIIDDHLTPLVGWSAYSLRREWNVRKHDVAPWWPEVSKEAFASGCANLADALTAWSSSKRGARAGRPVGFPGFHGRRHKRSVTFTTGAIRVTPDRHHVVLPRIGTVHTLESTKRLSRLVERGQARITRATVSWHRGRWVVTLLARVQTTPPTHPRPGSVVGVDVGVKDLLVAATPDGTEVARVPVPDRLRALEDRKARAQRAARRRQGPDRRAGRRASNRWKAAQARIARLDHRAANLREDVLHQATTALTRRYETVVVETLSVRAMATRGGARKRGLNRAIGRAAMAQTRQMVAYKTTREGGRMVAVDRFHPSSKTCSGCGTVKAKLALSERTYHCTTCGTRIDRDLNAATNLARQGQAGSTPVTGRGGTHKTTTPSRCLAAADETSTHPHPTV